MLMDHPSGSSSISSAGNHSTRRNSSAAVASFQAFLEQWLVHQEHYLDELLCSAENRHSSRDSDLQDLVDRVVRHYQHYFDEKSRVAMTNVSILFSPPWLTRLERSFLWVAGFKPGTAIELAMDSVGGELSRGQAQRMERLRQRTRTKEKELNDEVARLQESVAFQPVLETQRMWWRVPVDGEEMVMDSLWSGMEEAVMNADLLRTSTALGLLEILNPGQRVKFLAAAAQLQLRIRSWGLERDAHPHHRHQRSRGIFR